MKVRLKFTNAIKHHDGPEVDQLETALAQEFRKRSDLSVEILEGMHFAYGSIVINPFTKPKAAFENGVKQIDFSGSDQNEIVFDQQDPVTRRKLSKKNGSEELDFMIEQEINGSSVRVKMSNLLNSLQVCADNDWQVAFDTSVLSEALDALNSRNPQRVYEASLSFKKQLKRYKSAKLSAKESRSDGKQAEPWQILKSNKSSHPHFRVPHAKSRSLGSTSRGKKKSGVSAQPTRKDA